MSHHRSLVCMSLLSCASSALAQAPSGPAGGLLVQPRSIATPENPIVLIDVFGWCDPAQAAAFQGAKFYAFLSEGAAWEQHQYALQSGSFGWASTPGPGPIPSIYYAHVGQCCEPPATPGYSTANPLLLLTLAWTTADFTPRESVIAIAPLSPPSVYQNLTSSLVTWLPLDPVYANVQVIPAPASTALLAAAGVHALRRRRASMKNYDSSMPDRRPRS